MRLLQWQKYIASSRPGRVRCEIIVGLREEEEEEEEEEEVDGGTDACFMSGIREVHTENSSPNS